MVSVASIPCVELFDAQSKEYKDGVSKGKVLAVEASRDFGWYKFADAVVGMEGFGASGKDVALFEKFGFTAENIAKKAKELI
jgi:transketolase